MLTMSYSFGSQEGHDSALLTFLQPQHIHIPFHIQKASFTPRSPYPSPRTHPFLSLPHPASASASSGNNSNGAGSPSSPHLHCPLTCLLAHAPHFSSSHYVGMNRPCSHQKPNPFTVFQCPSHLTSRHPFLLLLNYCQPYSDMRQHSHSFLRSLPSNVRSFSSRCYHHHSHPVLPSSHPNLPSVTSGLWIQLMEGTQAPGCQTQGSTSCLYLSASLNWGAHSYLQT